MFCTIHVSQSHEPSGFLNLSPKPSRPPEVLDEVVVVAAAEAAVPEAAVAAAAKKPGAEAAVELLEESESAGRVRPGFTPVPGLAVSHATHLSASGLFCTRQVSHSHVPAGGANMAASPVVALALKAAAGGLLSSFDVNDEEEEEEEESVWGLEVWQATHLVSDAEFCKRHVSQVQEPAAGLNFSPKPERGRLGAG